MSTNSQMLLIGLALFAALSATSFWTHEPEWFGLGCVLVIAIAAGVACNKQQDG